MPSTSRQRLADAMQRRRIELGDDWEVVADRGGRSAATFRRLRTTGSLTPKNMAAIERGLLWQPGSVQAILDGGDPTPLPVDGAAPSDDEVLQFTNLADNDVFILIGHRGELSDHTRRRLVQLVGEALEQDNLKRDNKDNKDDRDLRQITGR